MHFLHNTQYKYRPKLKGGTGTCHMLVKNTNK